MTALSPATIGFVLTKLFANRGNDELRISLYALAILTLVQAMLPILQWSKDVEKVTRFISFKILPFLIIALCVVAALIDEEATLVPYPVFTGCVQFFLFFINIKHRFTCCRCGRRDKQVSDAVLPQDNTIELKVMNSPQNESDTVREAVNNFDSIDSRRNEGD